MLLCFTARDSASHFCHIHISLAGQGARCIQTQQSSLNPDCMHRLQWYVQVNPEFPLVGCISVTHPFSVQSGCLIWRNLFTLHSQNVDNQAKRRLCKIFMWTLVSSLQYCDVKNGQKKLQVITHAPLIHVDGECVKPTRCLLPHYGLSLSLNHWITNSPPVRRVQHRGELLFSLWRFLARRCMRRESGAQLKYVHFSMIFFYFYINILD